MQNLVRAARPPQARAAGLQAASPNLLADQPTKARLVAADSQAGVWVHFVEPRDINEIYTLTFFESLWSAMVIVQIVTLTPAVREWTI